MNKQGIVSTVLKLMLAALVVLGLAACRGPQNTHAENKNAAHERWLAARSNLFLQSAQRQFDTGDLTQCERTLAEALAMDPGNARLHTLAGRVHLERGQLERAYHRFAAANELDDQLPDAYYYMGIVLERWQRYEQALTAYERAFELEADNVSYLMSVAEMHVALDDLVTACELLESKVVYFDQNAGIRVGVGHIYAMMGDFDKAARYLRQALLLQPDDWQVQEDLALVYVAAEQHDKAIPMLERLCAEPSLRQRTDLQQALASSYLKSGRVDRAREAYLRLTRLEPQMSEAWIRLGEIALAADDLTGALHAANRAIALAPNRHEGFLLAGLVTHKRGEYEQALRMFDRAAAAVPDNALPLILRGMTLEQAGRRDEAVTAYTQALRMQPDDTRVQRLLANVDTQ